MEKQRRDRVRIVVILLLIINLLATGAVAYGIADMWNAKQATEKQLGTMHVLYIGTNDKDTK